MRTGHGMARVGIIRGTLTRQLNNLGMRIQQTDRTFGAASEPPIRSMYKKFQNLKFMQ